MALVRLGEVFGYTLCTQHWYRIHNLTLPRSWRGQVLYLISVQRAQSEQYPTYQSVPEPGEGAAR